MGVYIEGLKIPQSGQYVVVLTSSGMVEDVNGFVVGKAVEVKAPHGRLIDADALESESADLCCDNGYYGSTEWGFSYDMIDNAPTIIEAWEKDNG